MKCKYVSSQRITRDDVIQKLNKYGEESNPSLHSLTAFLHHIWSFILVLITRLTKHARPFHKAPAHTSYSRATPSPLVPRPAALAVLTHAWSEHILPEDKFMGGEARRDEIRIRLGGGGETKEKK